MLDLSNMSLFAIAGDTGAGKSTLLDAMLYALYGVVPRIGKQGIGELISHGRNVLSVTFDFSLQGRSYRLMRRATKNNRGVLNSAAALAELTPGGERSIADTVTTVNDRIEQLLGLGFDAFTQTVILPQNEFARFLQSPAKDRREILQHLLRHQIYEEMRRRAERRKDLLGRDLASKAEQLDRLQDATAAALEALHEELSTAIALVVKRDGIAKDANQSLAELQAGRELTIQLDVCRKLAAEYDKQAPAVEQMETELTTARASVAVCPYVDAEDRARKSAADCADAHKRDEETLAQVKRDHEATVEQREEARRNAADIPNIRERLQRLAEIAADVTRRPGALRELADARDKHHRQALALEADVAAATRALEVESAARANMEMAQAALGSVAYDPSALKVLDELREDATVAENLRAEGERLERDLRSREADVETKTAKLEDLQRSRNDSASHHDRARTALRAAEEAKSEGERRHAVATLQDHLHVGDVCPVCERQVSELPSRALVPVLESLRAARDEAAAAERTRAESLLNADRAVQRAETALDHARSQLTAIRNDLAERRNGLDERLARIVAVLTSAGGPLEEDVLPAFRAALAEMQRRAQAAAHGANALRDAEKSLATATLTLQRAHAKAREGEQVRDACDENVKRLERELAALEKRIAAVTSADDPALEKAVLSERIEQLESAVRSADAAVSEAALRAASAGAHLAATLRGKQEAAEIFHRAQAALAEALRSHGLESAEAVKRARRTADEIRSLEIAVRQFGEARAANQVRMAELEPKIAGREVQEASVTAATNQAEVADRQLREALANRATLEERVSTMTKRVAEAERLRKERGDVAARHAVTAEIAGDLRTDGFQTYLLEEAFKDLVDGASERLRKVSARYTMECNARGEFYVLDHDNASERRRAETLSGGETFMASLCLALQLSEEVLRASGAIRMDSLFIDEGFGTLDTDSLSEVTDALEALRDDGDRVIGIISHRAELTDRLPGCIAVEKGVGESKWVVERIG